MEGYTLKDLEEWDEKIQARTEELGLSCYPQEFEICDYYQMLGYLAYNGMPAHYPHWSFGKAFEKQKTLYDYGMTGLPYEMVINSNPALAYLMKDNSLCLQILTMAHVYAHCFVPGTKIETDYGPKDIEAVAVGDKVLTHRGRYRPVKEVGERLFSEDIQTLYLSGGGKPVRVTGDHPILAVRTQSCVLSKRGNVPCRPNCQGQRRCRKAPHEDYCVDWILAKQLKPGDMVAYPIQRVEAAEAKQVIIPVNKILWRQHIQGELVGPVSKDLARFMGYFLSEGHATSKGSIGFSFNLKEKSLQVDVKRLVKSLWGKEARIVEYPQAHSAAVLFNSIEIAEWLRRELGELQHHRRVPEFILEHSDSSILLECMRGIFWGDGTCTNGSGRKSGVLQVSTTSELLAYQLRRICSRWGIHTAIYCRHRPGRRTCWNASWTGTSMHKLSRLLFGEDALQGNRSFSRSWTDDNFIFFPIRAVKVEPYSGWVYNLSVEEDNTYTLASGVIVHNCHFFKNNRTFRFSRPEYTLEMFKAHASRLRSYIEDPSIGIDSVEKTLDAAHALSLQCHRYLEIKKRSQQEIKQQLLENYRRDCREARERMAPEPPLPDLNKLPLEPEEDVLLFIRDHNPYLADWQRDLLTIVAEETRYFLPQMETKVADEGIASFLHYKILNSLELPQSLYMEFLVRHNQVIRPVPGGLSPYHLGFRIFQDIEKRFGWDRVLQVVETDRDVSFLRQYLTEELMREMNLFSHEKKDNNRIITHISDEEDWEVVKEVLLKNVGLAALPVIKILDANYRGQQILYLWHDHDGRELELSYAQQTLRHLFDLWQRRVILESRLEGKPVFLSYDGKNSVKITYQLLA